MQRRDFLAGVAGASLASCGSGALAPVPSPSGLPWGALASKLQGRLVRPGEAGFHALALPDNLRYASILPAGIAVCESAADVSASILWARRNGVALVARSGGHSYAGYSCTRGLQIDVTRLRNVAFDTSTGVLTIGAGARNDELFSALERHGVAITHGNCLGVGVAGFLLGGGIGLNMRRNGLACDQLVSTEIVTADGTVHVAGEDSQAELYWACRGGGGGNFGINTQFSLQTFPVGTLTAFNLTWNGAGETLFNALAEALQAAPDTFGIQGSVVAPQSNGGAMSVATIGQLFGRPEELAEILAPVNRIAVPVGRVVHSSYWNAQRRVIEEGGSPGYSAKRSRYFLDRLDAHAIAEIFAWLRRAPENRLVSQFTFFLTGGAVNAVAPAATAFVHREGSWLGRIDVGWDANAPAADIRESLAWQNEFYRAIVPTAKGGAYQNFVDPELRDWKTAYYGSNLARLEHIKQRVDPSRVFAFAQAIP